MLFNSFEFLQFFAVVFVVYAALSHRWQNRFLLVASYFFYGSWDWRFLSLLLISTGVDYCCALAMERSPGRKKRYLLVSLCTNLGILGTFKYFDFFSLSAARLLEQLGFHADFPTLNILLPVGISFYTFQTMAYTIDVYRGRDKAARDLTCFALYVAYFPQLVAGPIERSTHLLPEFQKPRVITWSKIASALPLVIQGYFKKVLIADGVAPVVDRCFSNPGEFSSLTLLLGVYLFAIQIYGDFSGYTDIARGISRMLGIELCLNFRQPYLSSNITEFWHRWHMSLSSWLRDYLYIPLGGNRRGQYRTYINNMLTMLLGGLWHGASLKFIVWGGLHGVYLAIHKLTLRGRRVAPDQPSGNTLSLAVWLMKTVVTFHLVCFAWIFFRSDSLTAAMHYIGGILQGGSAPSPLIMYSFLFYGALTLLVDLACFFQNSEVPTTSKAPPFVVGAAYAAMVYLIIVLGERNAQPFIYFQF